MSLTTEKVNFFAYPKSGKTEISKQVSLILHETNILRKVALNAPNVKKTLSAEKSYTGMEYSGWRSKPRESSKMHQEQFL
jgi:hypothetical protein